MGSDASHVIVCCRASCGSEALASAPGLAVVAILTGGFLRARLGLFGCAAGSAVLAGASGGAVWAIRHQQDLAPVEGIGALLRY